jgi:hypothetical protein
MAQSGHRISSATSIAFHPVYYGNKESVSAIPFLDVLDIRKGPTLATNVYRQPTHTTNTSTSNLTIRRM